MCDVKIKLKSLTLYQLKLLLNNNLITNIEYDIKQICIDWKTITLDEIKTLIELTELYPKISEIFIPKIFHDLCLNIHKEQKIDIILQYIEYMINHNESRSILLFNIHNLLNIDEIIEIIEYCFQINAMENLKYIDNSHHTILHSISNDHVIFNKLLKYYLNNNHKEYAMIHNYYGDTPIISFCKKHYSSQGGKSIIIKLFKLLIKYNVEDIIFIYNAHNNNAITYYFITKPDSNKLFEIIDIFYQSKNKIDNMKRLLNFAINNLKDCNETREMKNIIQNIINGSTKSAIEYNE